MKPASPQLLALLAGSDHLFEADIFTFVLAGGAGTLRYCAGDLDVMVNGMLYPAGGFTGPFFQRSGQQGTIHYSIGVQVDTLTFDVIGGVASIFGVPFLAACARGVFEGAEMTMERLYMPSYGDTRRGALRLLVGRVAEVDVGRTVATFNINDYTELLSQNFPRNVYQAGCLNNWGDNACGVNQSAFASTLAVASGSDQFTLKSSFSTMPSGQYDQGKVIFTSGLLAGTARSIKTAVAGSPGTITLLWPLPDPPAIGDSFTIFPGCDKTFGGVNGCPKFNNQARFRGMDRIPAPETAV